MSKVPTQEELYDDYVKKCKASNMKPLPFENVFGNNDNHRPQPRQFKSTYEKKKEQPMAKATIIPIDEIMKETGWSEEKVRAGIKAMGLYPANMTRTKVEALKLALTEAEAGNTHDDDLSSEPDVIRAEPPVPLKNRFEAAGMDDPIVLTKRQLIEIFERGKEEGADAALSRSVLSTEEVIYGIKSMSA